ncbi:MAG: hypothetical protein ACLVL7_07795 [Anaerotruncus massiliensis (ex Togo et al. 2019)]
MHLDETAKVLLMSVALGEIGGELCAYRKNVSGAAFAATMCEAVGELKTAGADPETLRAAAGRVGGPADKLSDVALIFDAYQGADRAVYGTRTTACAAPAGSRGAGVLRGVQRLYRRVHGVHGREWKLLGRILEEPGGVGGAALRRPFLRRRDGRSPRPRRPPTGWCATRRRRGPRRGAGRPAGAPAVRAAGARAHRRSLFRRRARGVRNA